MKILLIFRFKLNRLKHRIHTQLFLNLRLLKFRTEFIVLIIRMKQMLPSEKLKISSLFPK